jgi:hypothetical protein
MIDSFSPFSRRVIVLGLLVLKIMLVTSLFLIPLSQWVLSHLDLLEDSRLRLERVQVLSRTRLSPTPHMLSQEMFFQAGSDAAAQDLLNAHLQRLTELNGLTDADIRSAKTQNFRGMLRSDLTVSGQEQNIARFVNELEAGNPKVRFGEWSIGRENDGLLTLEARVIAGRLP